MKRFIRLSESEMKDVIKDSVKKVLLKEHVDYGREIRLAQKTLCQFPLSEVGMRLDGTPFYNQFKKMRDSMVELNNMLIKNLREKK